MLANSLFLAFSGGDLLSPTGRFLPGPFRNRTGETLPESHRAVAIARR